MEKSEQLFIEDILLRLKGNIYSYFSMYDYEKMDPNYKGRWIKRENANSKICNLCFNKNCRIEFEKDKRLLPCPHGIPEVIEINEEDRSNYHFEFSIFLEELSKGMETNGEINWIKQFHILGYTEYKKSNWKIMFTFGWKLEQAMGELIEIHLRNLTTFTLILVDEVPRLNSFYCSMLQNLGIFIENWKEYKTQILAEIYQQKRPQWEVRKELESLAVDDMNKRLLATLEKAATSGDGDWFEDEVYRLLKKIVPFVVPFGAQYKGFSVPDGMIFGGTAYPFPTLFYDCKSSTHDDYATKPEVAMQVNYYLDFLSHFHNQSQKYENSGFVIFADTFDEVSQKKITGSPQWKLVQEKGKLFYVDRRCLERIESFTEVSDMQMYINAVDVFNICFNEKINVMEDSQVQIYYEKLFPTSSLNKFRFLKPEQFEIAIIAAIINEFYRINIVNGTRDDIAEGIRKAKHDNMVRKWIQQPNVFPFISIFIKLVKENKLHPLSILLIAYRLRSSLQEALGQEGVMEIIYAAEDKIKDLLNLNNTL
ncbi:hypothetical protein BA202_20725 [Bacillus cereus]|nr:hypothetical protein BA202_20725 [Bacillus cereus]